MGIVKMVQIDFILIDSSATGLRPLFDGADRWIKFLNATIIINASTEIAQLMTDRIDSNCIFFI